MNLPLKSFHLHCTTSPRISRAVAVNECILSTLHYSVHVLLQSCCAGHGMESPNCRQYLRSHAHTHHGCGLSEHGHHCSANHYSFPHSSSLFFTPTVCTLQPAPALRGASCVPWSSSTSQNVRCTDPRVLLALGASAGHPGSTPGFRHDICLTAHDSQKTAKFLQRREEPAQNMPWQPQCRTPALQRGSHPSASVPKRFP